MASMTSGTPALELCLGKTPVVIERVSHGRRGTLKWSGRLAATPKLCIVDLIAEHDVEAHKELTCESDPRLGASAAMQKGEVAASQIIVGTSREGRGLAEHPAEERAVLLGDLPGSLFIGGGLDSRGESDVADDVLAVGEASDASEGENGR
jgi:hypothetical protein